MWPSCACGVEANTSKGKPCTCCEAPSHCRAPGGSRISRSGSLQQLAPESGAIVSCRRSCPGHAADEDEEEEVDEEEEEDEEEEKEAMEKEPHLTQMRLALPDISDPAELCALPRMISLTAQGIAEAAKGRLRKPKPRQNRRRGRRRRRRKVGKKWPTVTILCAPLCATVGCLRHCGLCQASRSWQLIVCLTFL